MRRLTPDHSTYNRIVVYLALHAPNISLFDIVWFTKRESEYSTGYYALYLRCEDIVHPDKGRLLLKIPIFKAAFEDKDFDIGAEIMDEIENARTEYAGYRRK